MFPPFPPRMPFWPGPAPWQQQAGAAATGGNAGTQVSPHPHVILDRSFTHQALMHQALMHQALMHQLLLQQAQGLGGQPAQQAAQQPAAGAQAEASMSGGQQQAPGAPPSDGEPQQAQSPQPVQQFLPVLPVNHPGLPLGARHRHYWTL